MSQYMEKTVFTHQISPYFYTNGISPNHREWSTAKDISSNSPDVVRAHLGQSFGNKMCVYMAPMNLWEFHARVFSVTGGGKKFRTGAGGLGIQSIVMEVLITCACKRSKVNSRS